MKHEALLIEHVNSTDFFQNYLGEDVIVSIGNEQANPINMEEEKRNLLKQVLLKFSELMPKADHVVRRDVGTNFTMYVGYQSPGGPQRGHYVDITAIHNGFIFTIGGSAEPEKREQLANQYSETQRLHKLTLTYEDSFEEFSNILQKVALIYNVDIAKQKLGVEGWTPATCRKNEGKGTLDKQVALKLVAAHFASQKNVYTEKQQELLKKARDSILVPSVMQGLPVSLAFSRVVGNLVD